MLIVAGTIEVDPARRDDFIASRLDAMRASRAEDGCFTYVVSADPIEPGVVNIYERWESKEALGAHLAGMQSAAPPPADVEMRNVDVLQYEISSVGPLGS
jgi:quinol monooxygenase YgiN